MLALVLVHAAFAHRPGLSYARIDEDEVVLTFARPELQTLIPLPPEIQSSASLVDEMVLRSAKLSVGSTPCEVGKPTVRPVEGDGIEIAAPLSCPPGPVTYTAEFLSKLGPGHRHYVEAHGEPVGVLDATAPSVTTEGRPDRWEVAKRFVKLGVEHIWTGYDHLLFLLGLLIAADSLRTMLFVVTGFTVAHSITLSLAALGLVHISPTIVEPAIAATIAFVGVENFFHPPARRRVLVTFVLGLVHGFGFAGMLQELGLPRSALATALVSFNGGVELGQATVVAVALPVLLQLRRFPGWQRRVVPALSIFVAAAGIFWFVQRVMA
jgi:hydrogenase/urease accessory protein HupE